MSLLDDFPLIEQLPPERGERKKKFVVVYSCCCCCCCCLHTVGAAIGAVVGGRPGAEPEIGKPSLDYRAPSQWLYWSSFLIAWLLSLAIIGMMPLRFGDTVARNTFDLAMYLGVVYGPLWFLGGSVVMAMRIPMLEDPADRAAYWRQLAWITAGIVFGTLAGVAIMYIIFIFMTAQ